jgi:hypothetical protein
MLSKSKRLGDRPDVLTEGVVKTYLPLVLVVGGVHLALIVVLTLSGNLSARSHPKSHNIEAPVEALRQHCELHRVARAAGMVQVIYGKQQTVAPQYTDAKTRYFPNAWFFIGSGAEATPESPRQATVRYCPTCRAVEKRWRAQFSGRSTF